MKYSPLQPDDDGRVRCSAWLACPFCGCDKIMLEGQTNWCAAVCQRCQAQGPKTFRIWDSGTAKDGVLFPDEAVGMWNARRQANEKLSEAADGDVPIVKNVAPPLSLERVVRPSGSTTSEQSEEKGK